MRATEHQGEALKYLVIEPDEYDLSRSYPMVVLLHGYGSHMGDLASLCPAIDPRGYIYVCPNAPLSMDLGYGAVGYAWTNPPMGDVASSQSAMDLIATTVDEVTADYEVPQGEVVLGGFSQGGMLTYMIGLPRPEVFRGLIVLSGGVTDPDDLRSRLPKDRSQPVFVSHGTDDTMIPVEDGRLARQLLEDEGYSLDYHEYPMAHEITADVIADLTRWLHRVLPPAA